MCCRICTCDIRVDACLTYASATYGTFSVSSSKIFPLPAFPLAPLRRRVSTWWTVCSSSEVRHLAAPRRREPMERSTRTNSWDCQRLSKAEEASAVSCVSGTERGSTYCQENLMGARDEFKEDPSSQSRGMEEAVWRLLPERFSSPGEETDQRREGLSNKCRELYLSGGTIRLWWTPSFG